MDYIYQLIPTKKTEELTRETVITGFISVDGERDNMACIKAIEDKHEEYFEQHKGSGIVVVLGESNEFWENYWNQELSCVVCGKKTKLIDINHKLKCVDKDRHTCSDECEKARFEKEYTNGNGPTYTLYTIRNTEYYEKVYVGHIEGNKLPDLNSNFLHVNLELLIDMFSYGDAQEYAEQVFEFRVLDRYLNGEKTLQEVQDIEAEYIKRYCK